MPKLIGAKLAIAGTIAALGAMPASACDGCDCGSFGYGYGPAWGYASPVVVAAPLYNPAPVVAVVPAAPRVVYSAPAYSAYYAPSYGYGYYRSAGYGFGYRYGRRGWRW